MSNRVILSLLGVAGMGIANPAAASPGPLAKALGATDDLQVSASIRLRLDGIDAPFRPTGPNGDSMISLRTDVVAEYDAGPIRIGGEVQDSRSYMQAPNSTAGTGEVNALEPIQAFVRFELGDRGTGSFGKGAQSGHGLVTLGRFTMDLGGRRLVARNRFRNTTNAFTGVQAEWASANGARLMGFWTMPQVRLPDGATDIADNKVEFDRESADFQFFGADVTMPGILGGSVEGYAFRLFERDRTETLTRNRRVWTVGGRLFAKPAPGKPDHDIEAAYQFGRARRSTAAIDTADLDVSAWLVHVEAGYTLATGAHPRVSVVFDGASGDSGRAGHYGRFDTLFGARRSEFGPTSLFGALGRANLVSPGIRVEAAPNKRLDLMAMARTMWAEDGRDAFASTAVKNAPGASGKFAGHQIEGRVRYWLVPGLLQSDIGAAFLLKRGLLRDAPNARANGDTAYGYMDLTLTL